jgi:hypothetical protein
VFLLFLVGIIGLAARNKNCMKIALKYHWGYAFITISSSKKRRNIMSNYKVSMGNEPEDAYKKAKN